MSKSNALRIVCLLMDKFIKVHWMDCYKRQIALKYIRLPNDIIYGFSFKWLHKSNVLLISSYVNAVEDAYLLRIAFTRETLFYYMLTLIYPFVCINGLLL